MLQIAPQHVPHFSTLDHRVQMEQHVSHSPSVQLPRRLTRPEYVEVDAKAIAAVNPELSGVPTEYVEKYLASLAPQMLAAVNLLSTPSSLPKSRLPGALDVPIRPSSSMPPREAFPTHILAVTSSKATPSNPTTPTAASFAAQAQHSSSTIVPLYPTHSLVLAVHCTLLPALASPRSSNRSAAVNLPVVPLSVPDATTFPHLHAYLHTKRADTLLATLLPGLQGVLPAASSASASSSSPRPYSHQFTSDALLRLAQALASHAYTQSGPQGALQNLMAHARVVNGLWKNTCALGVFDAELWAIMDLAWEIILAGLNRIVEVQRRR